MKWLLPFLFCFIFSLPVQAHHVLGRPAYSLNESSNTPPSMQAEVWLEPYLITYMAFPAFPKPDEPGRVNIYISRSDGGLPFEGEVTFSILSDSWLRSKLFGNKHQATLGTQNIDDGIYRQGFLFNQAGNYIARVTFFSEGEPYVLDFPLTIGETSNNYQWLIALICFSLIVLANLGLNKRFNAFKVRQQQTHTETAPVNQDRRNFFRDSAKKTVKLGLDTAEKSVKLTAQQWIRPPFAIEELDFLSKCTRCNKCVDVCPQQTIFPLPLSVGALAAGTPALDLSNKACHLCEDWPCVSACDDQALLRTPDEKLSKPLATIEINQQDCIHYQGIGCGACRDLCPVPKAFIWEEKGPVIDSEHCLGCGICREACITDPKAITVKT